MNLCLGEPNQTGLLDMNEETCVRAHGFSRETHPSPRFTRCRREWGFRSRLGTTHSPGQHRHRIHWDGGHMQAPRYSDARVRQYSESSHTVRLCTPLTLI